MQRERENIAKKLDAVNRRFYAQHSKGFDKTRKAPWPGWFKLIPTLHSYAPTSVIDVGCGNGRFAQFLADHLHGQPPLHQYIGLDREPNLLDIGRHHALPFAASWCQWDWMKNHDVPINAGANLIVAFGVMHHIFGYRERLSFLARLGAALQPNGLLIVSTWDFGREPRYQKKYLCKSSICQDLGIRPASLETHDYFLGFGNQQNIPRYCHWANDEEMSRVQLDLARHCPHLKAVPSPVDPDDLNRYWIWQTAKI